MNKVASDNNPYTNFNIYTFSYKYNYLSFSPSFPTKVAIADTHDDSVEELIKQIENYINNSVAKEDAEALLELVLPERQIGSDHDAVPLTRKEFKFKPEYKVEEEAQ